MFLWRLTFDNYRAFYGHQTLDMSFDFADDRNVILIGGLNGSGKTTILDAIRLGLYGEKTVDLIPKGMSYQKYIESSLNNRAKKEGVKDFGITLQFATGGVTGYTILEVIRRWELDNSLFREYVQLTRDGEILLEFHDSNEVYDYLNYLIPQSVSKFFLFDGEKIQSIADKDDVSLLDSLKDILNINLFSRLETDLKDYNREIMRNDPNVDGEDIEVLENELLELIHQKELEERQLENLQAELAVLDEEIGDLTLKLHHLGGSRYSFSSRDELDKKLTDIKEQREKVLENVRTYAREMLPYLLIRDLMIELKDRLVSEDRLERRSIGSEQVLEFFEKLELMIKSNNNAVSAWYQLKSNVDQLYLSQYGEVNDQELLHNLSHTYRIDLLEYIASFNGIDKNFVRSVEQLKSLEDEIDELRYIRDVTPDNSVYSEIAVTLHSKHRSLGVSEQRINEKNQKMSELETLIVEKQKAIYNLGAKVQLSETNRGKKNMVDSLINAMQEFLEDMARDKAEDVRFYLDEMFHNLHRKGHDLVNEFRVNPETLEIKLFDYENNEISKRDLSAGEKEIFAFAFLWAMAKTSGKDLSVMIDTPLGRLDSFHRDAVVNRFLPEANRQVMLLSTDTEVNEQLFGSIKSRIIRSYRLEHLNGEGFTEIRKDYFFEG